MIGVLTFIILLSEGSTKVRGTGYLLALVAETWARSSKGAVRNLSIKPLAMARDVKLLIVSR